jgi:hypothetical protein
MCFALYSFGVTVQQQGKAYLEFLTAPLLHAASALESPIELDPARNPSAQDREQSARRVLEMAQAFLVHVCASAHRCPLYPPHSPIARF